MAVSLFLVYEHFSDAPGEFCTFGSSFDCGIVNKSPYANIDGISYFLAVDLGMNFPVISLKEVHWALDLFTSNAFLVFILFVILFVMYYTYKSKKDFLFIKNSRILLWEKGLIIFSIVYGLFLVYIQHFILKTYCIFCLSLDVILVLSLILIWREK